MASLICRPDGSKEVQFIDPVLPDVRRNVRMGKKNMSQGNAIREKEEMVIAAKTSGNAL